MADIWVVSDTHFQHYNMIHKFKTRPYDTVEEMDEALIDNWNSVVKPGDKVYHLGDVMFGSKQTFPKLWSRLRGRKRLVVGNHDDVKYLASGGFFDKISLWRMFNDWGLLFTHVPVHPSTLKEDRFGNTVVNVHGHIHQNPSPDGPYRCVCVEQINYTPINIEELKDEIL